MTTPDTEMSREDLEHAKAYVEAQDYIRDDTRNYVGNAFLAGIQHGRAAERERAAKIAETTVCQDCGIQHDGDKFIYKQVAERIRAGGEPEGKE